MCRFQFTLSKCDVLVKVTGNNSQEANWIISREYQFANLIMVHVGAAIQSQKSTYCKTMARCIKFTIDVNFAINGNYHGNRAQQPMTIKVSMVVTINGKFHATGP